MHNAQETVIEVQRVNASVSAEITRLKTSSGAQLQNENVTKPAKATATEKMVPEAVSVPVAPIMPTFKALFGDTNTKKIKLDFDDLLADAEGDDGVRDSQVQKTVPKTTVTPPLRYPLPAELGRVPARYRILQPAMKLKKRREEGGVAPFQSSFPNFERPTVMKSFIVKDRVLSDVSDDGKGSLDSDDIDTPVVSRGKNIIGKRGISRKEPRNRLPRQIEMAHVPKLKQKNAKERSKKPEDDTIVPEEQKEIKPAEEDSAP
jgi:hypothetical protein